jgi:hypothetical protein
MQPDSFHEPGAWVDEGDVDVGAHPQMVGRDGACVAAAYDDNLWCCNVIGHVLKTPHGGRT